MEIETWHEQVDEFNHQVVKFSSSIIIIVYFILFHFTRELSRQN